MYASENTTWTIPRLVVPRACHDNDLMKQALSIECDRIFCERTVPVCAITVLIVSGLMALLTFQNIDYPLLQIALILLLLTSLAGIGLAERLRHANLPRHWVLTILLWMTVVSGGVWGLVGFAMTAISDATTCFICLLVLAGAMASGVLMLCAIPNLNRFHLLAVSFPTALGYTLHSEQPNPALASLIICFALYLAVLSNRIFDRLLDTIRITLKYNAMPEYLRRAKNQMIQSLSKAKQEIAYHSQCHSTTLSMLPGVRYHAERHHGCWMLTDISNNAQSLFLYKPELLLGQRMSHLFELINVNARNISDQELIESARSKTCFEVEYSIINGEGKQRCIVERGRARFNASGKLASVEGILIDVTENPGLSKKHKEPGTYDALTAIPDRDEFCYRLQTSLGTVNHHPKGHTVILMNLDHFKIINDIYGHTAADKLLCQVSRRLSVSMQEGDTLARVSEDKFAVLLKGCDEQQARRFAQSLREMLEKDWYSWGKKRFDIKASFGIASTKYQCQDAETILNHAEQACALVKEQGLDCTQIYRDRDIKIVNCQKEKYWALQIPDAIAAERLFLVCQSIAPLVHCHAQGMRYEVLLRMHGSNGATITPDTFLPGAERYNLMMTLDQWVIDRVLSGLQAHPEYLDKLNTCFINISGQSLGHADFLDNVLARLDATDISADRLCFEITETAAIVNFSQALRFIQCLKSRGARFALDDFGSGLSTFDYLRKLPVDFLKVDGAFVRDIAHNAISRAMLRSINDFGQLTGKKTVAEFVESNAILHELQQIGFDFAQGYAISRPVPFEDLLKGQAVINSDLPGISEGDFCPVNSNQEPRRCLQQQLKSSTSPRIISTDGNNQVDSGHETLDYQQTQIDFSIA